MKCVTSQIVFLWVRSIIFLPQAWCIACMFTRPRPRSYIFKTEMRPRRWTLETETRLRRLIFPNSRDRDETFQKNVSRPPRDRDVQDRDYIPDVYYAYCCRCCSSSSSYLAHQHKACMHENWNKQNVNSCSGTSFDETHSVFAELWTGQALNQECFPHVPCNA